jgi:hypothetical protein
MTRFPPADFQAGYTRLSEKYIFTSVFLCVIGKIAAISGHGNFFIDTVQLDFI